MTMALTSRNYVYGDYEEYIQGLTRDNMRPLFVKNFGGWSNAVSKKKFFDVLSSGFVRLFFLNELFVGYVSFASERDDAHSFLIHDIHVVKEFQRKAFGFEILKFVEATAREKNAKQLKVFVFKDNFSLAFYTKNAFQEVVNLEKSNSFILLKKL